MSIVTLLIALLINTHEPPEVGFERLPRGMYCVFAFG